MAIGTDPIPTMFTFKGGYAPLEYSLVHTINGPDLDWEAKVKAPHVLGEPGGPKVIKGTILNWAATAGTQSMQQIVQEAFEAKMIATTPQFFNL